MYIPTIKEKNSSDMNSQKFDILLLFIQHIAEIILFWRFRELYGRTDRSNLRQTRQKQSIRLGRAATKCLD